MPQFLNHVTIAAPRNATNSHTVSPAAGTVVSGALFTPTVGRFLLCLCEGSVTSGSNTSVPTAAPTGWTGPTGNQAVNNTGLYLWHRVAAGGDSITTLHNAVNYPIVYDFFEFPEGTVFVKSVAATSVNNGATVTLPALTGTNWIGGAVGQPAAQATGSASILWSAGATELVDTYALGGVSDGYIYGLAYTEQSAATSVAWGATVDLIGLGGSNQERLMFALKPAAGGTGATVAPPLATATAMAIPPTVTTTGGATVAAVSATATAAMATPVVTSETVVTGGGPATATATAIPPTVTTSANITAVRAQATAAAIAPSVGSGATVLAPRATATATAIPPTVNVGISQAVTFTSTSSLASTGTSAGLNAVVMASTSTLATTGLVGVRAALALSSISTLAIAPQVAHPASVAFVSTSALSVTAATMAIQLATVTMVSQSSLATTPVVGGGTGVVFASTSALAAGGYLGRFGSATFQSASVLSVALVLYHYATINPQSQSTLQVSGTVGLIFRDDLPRITGRLRGPLRGRLT